MSHRFGTTLRIKIFFRLIFLLCSILVVSCAHREQLSYESGMRLKIQKYGPIAQKYFEPYFKNKGLAYPPRKLAFVIFKNTHRLHVYASNGGAWQYIKSFPVYGLGKRGRFGPKLCAGDHQTPEGIYHVIELNPHSRYDLSMRLDYPNGLDKKYAVIDHRTQIGNDIYIHGDKCSVGCIAIGNPGIHLLFPLVYYTGMSNVKVIIAPDDLRVQGPLYSGIHPIWLPSLYRQISEELQQFPEG